jgi:hypothetical protein
MHPVAVLLSVLVLWGSTLGIISMDKSARANKPTPAGEAPNFTEEPPWSTLIALCILCNIGALPYYFFATRKSGLWGFLGFLAFCGCATLMIIVRVVVSLVLH